MEAILIKPPHLVTLDYFILVLYLDPSWEKGGYKASYLSVIKPFTSLKVL